MIQHHTQGNFTSFLIGLTFIGSHVLFSALKKWKKARLVEDTPIVPIASAPQGFVEVQGFAWPSKNQQVTPLELQPCVYYSLCLEHYQSSGKSGRWVVIYEMTTVDSFFIVDSTGAVCISPDPGECSVASATLDIAALSSDQKQRIFAMAGKDVPNWLMGRYRVTQSHILCGSPAYALGTLTTQMQHEIMQPGVLEFIAKLHAAKHPSLLDLQKMDVNHDGNVSAEEWRIFCAELASKTISASVRGQNLQMASGYSGSVDPDMPALIKCAGLMTSNPDRKIYFADCHKAELEKRLLSGFLFKIVGSALLVAASIATLAYKFFSK